MPAQPIQFTRADAQALTEFAKLDLGEQTSWPSLGCEVSASKPRKYYPTLYVSGQQEIDIPLKGTATIEYRVRSKTKRQDDAGKFTESADIEVLSIDAGDDKAAVKPKAGEKAVVTKKDFARNQKPTQFAMNSAQLKAYSNGLKRPLKTSKRTPAVISRTPYDELRVAPRISTLKANGVPAAKAPGRSEAMAQYVATDGYGARGDATAEARRAAAALTRQNRKTKMLSAQDAAALVEFARGDQAMKVLPSKAAPLWNLGRSEIKGAARNRLDPNRKQLADAIRHGRKVKWDPFHATS
jgi:hypothetical protein